MSIQLSASLLSTTSIEKLLLLLLILFHVTTGTVKQSNGLAVGRSKIVVLNVKRS